MSPWLSGSQNPYLGLAPLAKVLKDRWPQQLYGRLATEPLQSGFPVTSSNESSKHFLSRRGVGCFSTKRFALFLLLSLAVVPWIAAQNSPPSFRVEGTVLDASGGSVPGARVQLHCGSYSASAVTDEDGAFSLNATSGSACTISVEATGFAPLRKSFSLPAGQAAPMKLILSPAAERQQIDVTATRTAAPLGETPLSDTQLSADQIENGSALTLDGALRQIPGFSLFRRSDSRVANPTTQGVSLRGLGANGSSRVLVLEDGFPLNDPFGAWVRWGRVPIASVESIEVSQGGASSLYGSDALGGVVQLLTRPSSPAGLSIETSYGNQNTPDFSLWAGGRKGQWESMLGLEFFSTDGYILVPSPERGSVDTAAGSKHQAVDWTIGRHFGKQGRLFGRGWLYGESRRNGTPDQTNGTRIGEGALGADTPLGNSGFLTMRLYGQVEHYQQTFSSIAADRNRETPTDGQVVPAQSVGESAQWTGAAGKHQTLVAGVDSQEVMGASDELFFSSGKPSARQTSGGRQRTVGIFGEDLVRIHSRWLVAASARWDHWRDFNAASLRTALFPPGAPVFTPFPDRSEDAFSPRLTVIRSLGTNVSLSASFYRAFRAPSLNELYRSFRVGNVMTLDNGSLAAERLTGGEAGASWKTLEQRLDLRGNFFWNDIANPIANVTLAVTPSLITRRRENLGRTRSAGVELEAVARLTSRWLFSTGYQYANAVVVSFPVDRGLEGLWIPQVPRHTLVFQSSYVRPRSFMIAVDGRFLGNAFDDDQNQFPLGRSFVLDATASHTLSRGLEIFVAAENLLNDRYDTAATPVPSIGLPFTARIGFRFQLPQH